MPIQFINDGFNDAGLISGANYQLLDSQADMNAFLPGWTLVAGDVDYLDPDYTNSGTQGVDLHGDNVGTISQTLDTSNPPTGTLITFEVTVFSPGTDDLMTVSVNGVNLIAAGQATATFTPAGTYTTYEYTFLSTGSDTIEIAGGGGAPNGGVYLDSVSVTDVQCLAAQTMIMTPHGQVPISSLRRGDLVCTSEGKLQAIQWTGTQVVDKETLKTSPKLRPVRITKGSLGADLPRNDLLVSRQHRMMVSSKIAERMFAAQNVLVPAIRLTALPDIYIDDNCQGITYCHLLFENHEIIFAEGAPTESLFTGPEALKSVSAKAKEEILTLFPELISPSYSSKSAAFCPVGRKQRKLVDRHFENKKPLLDMHH